MKQTLFMALEAQLETEKLRDLEIQANQTGEYEVLFDNVKQLQTAALVKAQDGQETSTENETVPPVSDDAAAGDISSVPGDKAQDEEMVPPANGEDEAKTGESGSDGLSVGTEGLRDLSFSLEEWSTYDVVDTAVKSKGVIATAFGAAVSALTLIGVVYGPAVVKTLYKGVIYVFGKLANLLYTSIRTLSIYIERRVKSFNNLNASIASLEKAVDLLETSESLEGQTYSNQKIINSLKIGSSIDLAANISVLNSFVKQTILNLDKKIHNDNMAIGHIIASSKTGLGTTPSKLLAITPFINSMQPSEMEGFVNDKDTTVSFKHSTVLPSDVVLIAFLPKQELESLEDITKAYNGSKIFLGMEQASFKNIASIDYMTPEQLKLFLKELKNLCNTCILHEKFYNNVMQSKKHLKFGFKNYFTSLTKSSSKVTVKDSLVELVYLRSMFIDKVYLMGAIDVHDYCAKIISYGLSLVEAHVKKLS
jgi:hypothetical protein